MNLSTKKLKKILLTQNQISEEAFDKFVREAKDEDKPLEDILATQSPIPSKVLGRIIADEMGIKYADLDSAGVSEDFLEIIPEVAARAQQAVVFDQDDEMLKLATAHPENYEFIKALEKKTEKEVDVHYSFPVHIKEELKHYKGGVKEELDKLIGGLKESSVEEGDIIKLVNKTLQYAYDNGASDIHMEPLETGVSVRMRIDGVLHEAFRYPVEIHGNVVTRIKIMSDLRVDEHGAAQDGRFSFEIDGDDFDIRVSIMPVTEGENIVMRILASKARRYFLDDLGLSEKARKKVQESIEEPHGMILSSGPTGSGKTTTLYALLHVLNQPEVNIMTIEDPVEYNIEHVQQSQINKAKDLTFATGLRSIVRQDPDIIMVGEVRDDETAAIAVNAAMTGHLVLSTFHANDAGTVFPRLIEMDIEPFLLSSSINAVIAQRLVRKVCTHCRYSRTLTEEEMSEIRSNSRLSEAFKKVMDEDDLEEALVYQGKGEVGGGKTCVTCGGTGFNGRTGIFEVMPITSKIKRLVKDRSTSEEIYNAAVDEGMTTMLEDGVQKVLEGVTTFSEVLRSVKLESI